MKLAFGDKKLSPFEPRVEVIISEYADDLSLIGGRMTHAEFVDYCVGRMPKPPKPKRDMRRRDIERTTQNMLDKGRLPMRADAEFFYFDRVLCPEEVDARRQASLQKFREDAAKRQTHRGRTPKEGWDFLSTIETEETPWAVFIRPQPSPDWITVKVCAQQPVSFKANYWLSWSGSRFAGGGDFDKLAEHRPALRTAVQRALVEHECGDLL
jgi:hypothetical protein